MSYTCRPVLVFCPKNFSIALIQWSLLFLQLVPLQHMQDVQILFWISLLAICSDAALWRRDWLLMLDDGTCRQSRGWLQPRWGPGLECRWLNQHEVFRLFSLQRCHLWKLHYLLGAALSWYHLLWVGWLAAGSWWILWWLLKLWTLWWLVEEWW